MDEIEAALDEPNVVRVADYMRRITNKTQFIVITHRRGTMEAGGRPLRRDDAGARREQGADDQYERHGEGTQH